MKNFLRWMRKPGKQALATPNSETPVDQLALEMGAEIWLVKGAFTPVEAADVLLSLVNDKIKFHTIQSLNLTNSEDDTVPHSQQRIAQLKEAKSLIKDLVIRARDRGYEVLIESPINIKLRKIDYQRP